MQKEDLTNAHIEKSLVPALDNLSSTELECERLISVETETEKYDKFQCFFKLLPLNKIKLTRNIETTEMQNDKLRQLCL